jgi:DHA3 family macrolide efflux protein-like MFS transporter
MTSNAAAPRQEGAGLFNRNFVLLLAGQIVSNLGNAVHMTAVVWYIMSVVGQSQSGRMVAAFSLCSLVPMLIAGPLAGVLADRWNRVWIIAGTDLLRGILFMLLAAATYMNIAPLASLFTITILTSALGSLFNPAVDASIPNMVDARHLMRANSLNGASRQLTWLVGAAAAGFLYEWLGIAGVFLVNGASFFLSGVSELFIRLPGRAAAAGESAGGLKGYMREFMEGLRYFRKDTLIITMMIFSVVLNFIFAPIFQVLFPKVLRFDLGFSARQYGLMESIFSVGAVLGMLVLSVVTVRNRFRTVMVALFGMVLAFSLFGVPVLPGVVDRMALATIFSLYGAFAVGMMMANSFVNMPITTAMQTRVPDQYRARFFGILTTFSMGATPVGAAILGVLVDTVPASVLFFGGGAICLVACIWMLATPALREL